MGWWAVAPSVSDSVQKSVPVNEDLRICDILSIDAALGMTFMQYKNLKRDRNVVMRFINRCRNVLFLRVKNHHHYKKMAAATVVRYFPKENKVYTCCTYCVFFIPYISESCLHISLSVQIFILSAQITETHSLPNLCSSTHAKGAVCQGGPVTLNWLHCVYVEKDCFKKYNCINALLCCD